MSKKTEKQEEPKSQIKDYTSKYIEMLDAFSCDMDLAVDPKTRFTLWEIQTQIQRKDERLLHDIELLDELVFNLRHNKLKIIESEVK